MNSQKNNFVLITGKTGVGKTINTIGDLDIKYSSNSINELPTPTIFYYGLPSLNLSKLKAKWVKLDDVEKWDSCPNGSIILIDQAHEVFNTSKDLSKTIKNLKILHKRNLTVFMITVHPDLINQTILQFVDKHVRIENQKMFINIGNQLHARVFDFVLAKKYFGVI